MKDFLRIRSLDSSNDVFIKFKKRQYSFEEMNDIIYDRSLSLLDFGIHSNDKVAIFLSNPFEFIEAYLACYKVRVTSLVLNIKWKKKELENALKQVPPDFIICQYSNRNLFTRFRKPLLFIEELSKSFGSCAPIKINDRIKKENIQSILFTSGTQGAPKPVCLTYDNFYQSSLKWKKAIELSKQDQYLLCLPLYHIGGLAIIMRALHSGFSININMNIKDDSIAFKKDSIISTVPTLLIDLMNNNNTLEYLKQLRCIVLSGSKPSIDLLMRCREHNLNIFLSYGMTETCSSISGFWLSDDKNLWDSVGAPFDGVNIKIKNNQIIIKSDTIMKSYFNHKLTHGVFKTFDKGEVKNNYLFLKGRSDGMIISGAENIDQNEIINAISQISSFDKIIPFKKTDPYWGEISGVYIYTNTEVNPDYIKSELKKIISEYKIPKEIIIKNSHQ